MLNSARRPGRRHIVVAAATALTLAAAAPAWAFWTATAATSTTATAQNLGAPVTVTVGSPTTSSLTVTVNAGPAIGPAPSAYLIQRNGITVTGCATVALGAGCTETGLTAGTQYTYTVFSLLGTNWVSASSTQVTGATMPATPAAPVMLGADDTGSSSTDSITKTPNPRFTGTAPANSTVSLFDGSSTTPFATFSSGSPWQSPATTLSAGAHSITAKVTANGVSSAASPPLSITIDTTAPNLGTASAACTGTTSSNNYCRGTTTVTVNGVTDAGSGIDSVTYSVTGGPSGTATLNGSTATIVFSSPDGSPTVAYTVTDKAGNSSSSGPQSLITKPIDNTAPTATITLAAAAPDKNLNNNDRVVIAFTEAGSGIDITKFCPNWNGGTVTGTVTVSTASALTVASNTAASGCAANSFTVGTVGLGASYLQSTRTVNASFGWDVATKTLTVTLTSSPPGGQLNTVPSSTPSWTTTPTGLGDLVGNPIGTVTGVLGQI